MRIIWRGWAFSALAAASLLVSIGAARAADQPVVHVKTVVKDDAVSLEAQANAPFDYTTYRPSPSLLVLDLSGVVAGDPAGARIVDSDLVKSYRLVPYTEGDKPMVRLEVLLAQGLEPQLQKVDAQDLVLSVNHAAPAVAIIPATAKTDATTSGVSHDAVSLIRNVTLANNGGKTVVTVVGSTALNYRPMHLENPDRLVLDFPSSRLGAPLRHLPSNLDPVREIRVAQFTPQTSRVVIDLREASAYNIQADGNSVTVSFGGKAAAQPGATPASQEPASNLTITQTQPAKEPARVSASGAQVPPPAVALPAQLTRASAALASRQDSEIQPQGVNAAMAAQSSGASQAPSGVPTGNPSSVPDSANGSPMGFAGGPAAAAPPPSTKYAGDPISVNLKDVDLADFFRLVHEISGLNIVVDPAVKGTLTIVLDNVPWDQALDIVLKNNDLDKQLDGNVLRIATRATLKSEAQEVTDLEKAQAEATDVVTTTRVLSYAKATSVAITLKKFLSSRGDILADDRSNTLIIRDIPSTFPVLDNLLRQLDRRSQQVEIEARVVAANRSFSREIGAMFGAAAGAGNSAVAGDSVVGSSETSFTPCPPVFIGSSCTSGSSAPIPLLSNLGASAPTSGVQYLLHTTNFALDAVIDAAESKGVGKLLSRPKVITQNNEKATVKQGTKIPVQTVVNNTVSVQFVDAVLELDVTPQITADGTVYMDVTVENDAIDNGIPRVQGIPAIDTQSAETKVTVNDGATVVIGGIIVTNQQTQVNDVPLVGSLPVIGNLFRHTTVSSTSQELLFFLTPRILPS